MSENNKRISENNKRIAVLALLAAMGLLLSMISFALLPSVPFLKYDPSHIVFYIAAFLYGPWWGFLVVCVSTLLQFITGTMSGGPVGLIMYFAAASAVVLISGILYQRKKTLKRALIALLMAWIGLVAVMIPLNLWLMPVYNNLPVQAVIELLLPAIIPFNALKGGLNALLTFLLYKRVSRLLK